MLTITCQTEYLTQVVVLDETRVFSRSLLVDYVG